MTNRPAFMLTMADAGASLVEAVVGLCIAAILAAFALPITASAVHEGRARHAAAFVAARLHDARQQAVTRTAATGLVFDRRNAGWVFRLCVDGNGNGLRRADIRAGLDACPGEDIDLLVLFPGVSIGVDEAIRGPDNDPPSADPIRFGSSDIASCSPSGGCTPGSLYLRSIRGAQYAVRFAGMTSRLRVLRYDAPAGVWRAQ